VKVCSRASAPALCTPSLSRAVRKDVGLMLSRKADYTDLVFSRVSRSCEKLPLPASPPFLCPSVRPHRTNRLPQQRISWNLTEQLWFKCCCYGTGRWATVKFLCVCVCVCVCVCALYCGGCNLVWFVMCGCVLVICVLYVYWHLLSHVYSYLLRFLLHFFVYVLCLYQCKDYSRRMSTELQ